MNKSKICIISLLIVFFLPQVSRAGLSNPGLKGKILLQVEKNGEAWYVDPVAEERVYLGRPADAFRVMRERGLGISEESFNAFLVKVPEKFAGRILLRVEAKGEAYYVNPKNLKMHFLGRPADAFRVMREQGLGITNNDLELIPADETIILLEQVTKKVLNYVVSLGQSGDKTSVDLITEEDCLYRFAVNVYGNKITSYSDKSATKFFPQVMDIPSEGLKTNQVNQYNQTLDQVKERVQNFINKDLVIDGQKAMIEEVILEDCLYKFTVDLRGTKIISYANRAVTKFFPQVMDMTIPIKTEEEVEKNNSTANQKKAKPEVELFVMTHCPYGVQIEKGILPVIKLLDGKIDFEIKFVDYAMHELKEVEESMRQYCIQKDQNQAYLSYLECFLKAGDSATCLKDGGIDQAALQTCITKTDAEFEIMAKYNDKTTWTGGRFPEIPIHKAETKKYGISGSPSFVINGEKISTGRSPQQLLDTICAGFIEKPEECSVSLSSDNPSPGFGSSASNSGGTANCAP